MSGSAIPTETLEEIARRLDRPPDDVAYALAWFVWDLDDDAETAQIEQAATDLSLDPNDPRLREAADAYRQASRAPVETADLRIVTLDEFADVHEPGAESLLGGDGQAVIPANGDVMIYGDGGAGKTTLSIDLACHLAAGDPWLGIAVARPLNILLIENEGPRPLLRTKLRRKRNAWQGSPIGGRIKVLEAPWAELTLADPECRWKLAARISAHDVDVVICGPVTRSGMNEAGTLQEVHDFMQLVAATRVDAGRLVTFVLIHHENKGGKVSGAWEGAVDTLLHVTGQGHGRTRLFVQKARWSSEHHKTTLNLLWTDGEGFALEAVPELNDEILAEKILAYVGEHPGTAWGKVEEATRGVNAQTRRDVRDSLLATGRLFNIISENGQETAISECRERKATRLYLADDPTISHLRPASDADQTQLRLAGGEGAASRLRPASRPKGTQDVDADAAHPLEPEEPAAGRAA